MDVWVVKYAVKYASRRSRIGDFSGDSSVRGAWSWGVLALSRVQGKRELSDQGTGWQGVRGRDQMLCRAT